MCLSSEGGTGIDCRTSEKRKNCADCVLVCHSTSVTAAAAEKVEAKCQSSLFAGPILPLSFSSSSFALTFCFCAELALIQSTVSLLCQRHPLSILLHVHVDVSLCLTAQHQASFLLRRRIHISCSLQRPRVKCC